MKVLILSSNNGQGHNSASKALLEAAEKRGMTAVMIDNMLFDSANMSEFQKNVYIQAVLHTPRVVESSARILGHIDLADKSKVITKLQRSTMDKQLTHLKRFIDDNHFDAVICAHVFPAAAISFLNERYGNRLATAFLATDYGYILLSSQTSVDLYCMPHANVMEEYKKIDPGKHYVVTGIPTSEKARTKVDKLAARQQLGLSEDAPILLIMTGSMGFGHAVPLIEKLKERCPENTQIITLCGNNTRLIGAIRKAFPEDPNVKAVSFTTDVNLYMSAADVLITKPGGLSTTEAAVMEIPLVLLTPISTWEEDNIQLFTELGMARSGKNTDEMAAAAASLLKDPEACQRMMQAQHYEINKLAADTLLDEVEKILVEKRK